MQAPSPSPSATAPLRLWPGVVIVALQLLARFGLPLISADLVVPAILSGAVGALLMVLWWIFLSRAEWPDRLGAPVLMVACIALMPTLLDVSIATGAQGMLYPISVVLTLPVAFVLWAAVTRDRSASFRRATMVATIIAATGVWTLVRTDGVRGNFDWDWSWRWAATSEERLIGSDTGTFAAAPVAVPGSEAAWSGFRGPGRDGVARGARVSTDWTAQPPVEIWKRAIGPGWSSFAVQGDLFYTQEQRGDEELVSAYRLDTGEPVWRHADNARFWEAMAGAGPRSTPTLAGGNVYALGALGVLNALDATTGAVLWSRDAAADADAQLPGWGYAGSPLVVGDLVVAAVSSRLAAYDAATGELRWTAGPGREGYSSPHLANLGGEQQILLPTGGGLLAVSPVDGSTLWEHSWPGFQSLQPAIVSTSELLMATSTESGGAGTRMLAIEGSGTNWSVSERWTSTGLKPYFNDLVVHDGHAYGFDGRILSCIDLATGERKWKGGRYGNGQMVLLPSQELLLVLSEGGEIALVRATPDGYEEVARTEAIEGKTWNHPVIVDDVLLVRNDEQMAAFRLAGGN